LIPRTELREPHRRLHVAVQQPLELGLHRRADQPGAPAFLPHAGDRRRRVLAGGGVSAELRAGV
jgi:hypothetical protein